MGQLWNEDVCSTDKFRLTERCCFVAGSLRSAETTSLAVLLSAFETPLLLPYEGFASLVRSVTPRDHDTAHLFASVGLMTAELFALLQRLDLETVFLEANRVSKTVKDVVGFVPDLLQAVMALTSVLRRKGSNTKSCRESRI